MDAEGRGSSGLSVLQVSSYAPPHLGGLETCAAGIFSGIRKRQVHIRWLFSDVPQLPPGPDTTRIRASNVVERLLGVPVPIPALSSLAQFASEVRAADVVHVHDVMYLNSLIAVVLAQRLRKPIVATLHIWKVPYRNPLIRVVQDIVHRTIGMYCLRRASAIVTYNREIFAKLEPVGTGKTFFVANGIAEAFEVADDDIGDRRWRELRSSLALTDSDHVVLFAGRFVSKKGLHLIRAAAARMPDTLFVMCGSGPINPGRWQLENVRVVGLLEHDELRKYFLASDLLLLPSKGEGFPLVVPEAMACGLPCGLLRETWAAFGEHPELFELLDENRIADDLRAFLTSSPDFERRRRTANFARSQWSWDATVDQYLEVFASVSHRSAPAVAGGA